MPPNSFFCGKIESPCGCIMDSSDIILCIAAHCDSIITVTHLFATRRGFPRACDYITPIRGETVYRFSNNGGILRSGSTLSMLLPCGETVKVVRGVVYYIDQHARVFVHNRDGWHLEMAVKTTFAGTTCTRDVLTKKIGNNHLGANSPELTRAISALRIMSLITARMS